MATAAAGALRLCHGAIKSPCARKLAAAAAPCARRGIPAPHQKKQATFCLMRASPSFRTNSRQMQWSIEAMTDDSADQSGDNNTRLFSAIQSFLSKLYGKLKKLRKGLPLKILFFLIGFYCATAFATVIGQTGDWDILSAGLAVAIVEGIGALMYRASFAFLGRIRKMITIFNYWKAGLTLGLFLDSFKYEVDEFLESCNPFNIDINIFSLW
uniref:Ycf20-like protein n=2 Tax=Oryza TaxID=4527 RepID=A0A0E0P412_ORYRU